MPFLRSVRLWFSLAVAVIAAAIADPLLEAASNGHVFGPGRFTDHSNLDVLPALIVGLIAVAIHVGLRIAVNVDAGQEQMRDRLRNWDRSLRSRAALLLPATFLAQLAVLYSMETLEQIAVAGHPLGGLIWLGAPAVIALTVHALACVIAFFVVSAVMHELAWATLRVVVSIMCAILTRDVVEAIIVPRSRIVPRMHLAPELSTSGGRAPPSYAP